MLSRGFAYLSVTIYRLFIGNLFIRQYPLFYLWASAVIFEMECECKISQMSHFENEQDTQVR